MVAERGGYDLMPEMGYAPTNKYLPPRPRKDSAGCTGGLAELAPAIPAGSGGFLGWIDQLLSR
jgi:sulfite dehydrogenase (quinone) subunit SoeB